MQTNARYFRLAFGACLAATLAACHAPAPRSDSFPTPSLELIGTAPLALPASCSAQGSVIVDFTVLADGRTSGIEPASAPSCVRDALTAWVASFRYVPPGSQTRTSVEWLLVEAKKGS
ncbi:MAG: hypothetical protein ACJ8MR_16175 [Povalibacter sp.]